MQDRVHPGLILATHREPVTVLATTNIADLATGAPLTVDGQTLVTGTTSALLIGQTNAEENGPYDVAAAGTGSDGTWTRRDDFDTSAKALRGCSWRILTGTKHASRVFYHTTSAAITLDTTALTFAATPLDNLAASAAPGATDDTAAGYSVGSVWIDTTNDEVYTCVDATATAAIWSSGGGSGGGTGGTTAQMVYQDDTAEADPGAGNIRLNHATPASATEAYIDDLTSDSVNIAALLSGKGRCEMTIAVAATPFENFVTFTVYGIDDESGYTTLLLEYRTGAGTLTDEDAVLVAWDIHDEATPADDLTYIIFDDFNIADFAPPSAITSTQWDTQGDLPGALSGSLRYITAAADIDGRMINRQRLLTFDITIEISGSRDDIETAQMELYACAERYGDDLGEHYSLEWPTVAPAAAADPKLYYTDSGGTKNLLATLAGVTFDSTTRTIAWRIQKLANGDVKHWFDLAGTPVTSYTHTPGPALEGYAGLGAAISYSAGYGETNVDFDYFKAYSTSYKTMIAAW